MVWARANGALGFYGQDVDALRQKVDELSSQLSRITTLAASNEVRVIAYGLYGGDARYTVGVLRNAQLAPLVYPGWKVRSQY